MALGRPIFALTLGLFVFPPTVPAQTAAPAAAPVPAQAAASSPNTDPKAAFERLKALAGNWEGTHTTIDGPAIRVEYRLTGGGSALVETLFAGTPHEMVSVYYMDGNDLVLTHYCALANQPRMKLASGGAEGDIVFDFAGGTNLDPAISTHIHGGRLAIKAGDRFDAEWQVWAKGKPADAHRLFMKRSARPGTAEPHAAAAP